MINFKYFVRASHGFTAVLDDVRDVKKIEINRPFLNIRR